MDYQESIIEHYKKNWNQEPNIHYWDRGPANKLPYDFRVLEFAPNKERDTWTYSTCCMSQEADKSRIELHMFSSHQCHELIELLTMAAYFHRTSEKLDLNHTIYFGKPLVKDSKCNYGFISLPYLDGPELENLNFANKVIKFYWLIPITEDEAKFKEKNGVDKLEELFEVKELNYLDNYRSSLT